jgi:hypothetical protein
MLNLTGRKPMERNKLCNVCLSTVSPENEGTITHFRARKSFFMSFGLYLLFQIEFCSLEITAMTKALFWNGFMRNWIMPKSWGRSR